MHHGTFHPNYVATIDGSSYDKHCTMWGYIRSLYSSNPMSHVTRTGGELGTVKRDDVMLKALVAIGASHNVSLGPL